MANPHRGAVALEAGGKVYSLRFTTNSICELEDSLGKPIMQIVNDMQSESGASMKLIRSLVWAALLDGHPGIGTKEAGALIDDAGMETITEKILLAIQRFFPDQEGQERARPPKAKAG